MEHASGHRHSQEFSWNDWTGKQHEYYERDVKQEASVQETGVPTAQWRKSRETNISQNGQTRTYSFTPYSSVLLEKLTGSAVNLLATDFFFKF